MAQHSPLHYKQSKLWMEGVSLEKLARTYGTPLYLYSEKTIRDSVQALQTGLKELNVGIHFAVKANSNLKILQILKSEKLGFDVVSGGELGLAIRAGAKAGDIVFSGVGKTDAELKRTFQAGAVIESLNVESIEELVRIKDLAKNKINLSLRFNPDIDAKSHTHISTGRHDDKFGMTEKSIYECFRIVRDNPNLKITGLSIHIGSQIDTMSIYKAGFTKILKLASQVKEKAGIQIRTLDLGGGLVVPDDPNARIPFQEYSEIVQKMFKNENYKLVIEPGRCLIARAGVLLTQVISPKIEGRRRFLIIDAGMNDLIRPALYQADHEIWPENKMGSARTWDIVGPVCESADQFGSGMKIKGKIDPGAYLAIMNAGAYGFSMASQYNSRPRSAEILVSGSRAKLIRRRETEKDLF